MRLSSYHVAASCRWPLCARHQVAFACPWTSLLCSRIVLCTIVVQWLKPVVLIFLGGVRGSRTWPAICLQVLGEPRCRWARGQSAILLRCFQKICLLVNVLSLSVLIHLVLLVEKCSDVLLGFCFFCSQNTSNKNCKKNTKHHKQRWVPAASDLGAPDWSVCAPGVCMPCRRVPIGQICGKL